MRDIIDNLTRQHKELVKVTIKLVQQLQTVARGNCTEAYKSLHALNGILRVHVAMEDRSFYPYLVTHRDPQLRQLAERFLSERTQIQDRYDRYLARYASISAIDSSPAEFVAESREILQILGMRMLAEDREFHPAVQRHFDR